MSPRKLQTTAGGGGGGAGAGAVSRQLQVKFQVYLRGTHITADPTFVDNIKEQLTPGTASSTAFESHLT
jgi:hypothetical protein